MYVIVFSEKAPKNFFGEYKYRGADMENLITFGGVSVRQINYAMQQNDVPIFRSITMKNNTSEELSDVTVRITFDPDFAHPYSSGHIYIAPGETVELSPVNISLSYDYLLGLTHKKDCHVTLEAVCGDKVIGKRTDSIELLAYDQWTGSMLMPEMICAFITPDHPKVREVIAKASEYMNEWCGDPSFAGYSNRSAINVKMQMGAIYAALHDENIAYTAPNESYEAAQRVRLPNIVLESRMGTCLDLSVLYCACLESVGLNSLLIFTNNHAFAGCWIEEETFSDAIKYNCTSIRKRISKGVDILSVVECTDFAAGKTADLETAEKHAAEMLEDAEGFSFAVDVKRSRLVGVCPMLSRERSDDGGFRAVYYDRHSTSVRNNGKPFGDVPFYDGIGEITKLQMWERKLLDLSLRNNLLNFHSTSSCVKLLMPNIGHLEDELASGDEFRLCSLPSDALLEASGDDLFVPENDIDHNSAVADSELKDHRLRTFMSASNLEKTMSKLRRQSKVSLEENGANTIYLALGFLEWYETEMSDRPRYAPLVLLPVTITRKIQDKAYTIKLRDDGTQINITLLEMLRQNFGIDIRGLENPPEDEKGIDIPRIFGIIRKAVESNPRWSVKELAFIGQFSFSRFIMWNDIRSRSADLLKNKVISGLISGKYEWAGSRSSISPTELDTDVLPSDLAVPIAADSSQLAAVYAANSGKSFVLHGPPGTGKSQTITNIIANALYHGKTVLFVAEKMAALEVVEKRLSNIGLGPFCLELHSNKSRKRDVLKKLDNVLSIGKAASSAEYKREAERIASLRRELNDTAAELHKPRNYGASLYDTIVKAERYAEYGGKFKLPENLIRAASAEVIDRLRRELEMLVAAGREFRNIAEAPLRCCRLTECTPALRGRLSEKLIEFKEALKALDNEIKLLSELCGRRLITYDQYTAETELIKIAASDGELISEIIYGDAWNRLRAQVMGLIKNGKEHQRLRQEILSVFEISVLNYDSGKSLSEWKSAQSSWIMTKVVKGSDLIKELNSHAKEPKTVTKQNFPEYCDKLLRYQALTEELKDIPTGILELFNGHIGLISNDKTDWSELEKSVTISEALRIGIEHSPFTANEKRTLSEQIVNYYGTASRKAELSVITEDLFKDHAHFEKILNELSGDFKITLDSLSLLKWNTAAYLQAEKLIASLPMLKEWTGIMSICQWLEANGLGGIAKCYLEGRVGSEDLLKAFDCEISRELALKTISENPMLSKFQGALFEDTVRKYGEELELFRSLTIRELVAKLSSNIPLYADSVNNVITVLKKSIKNGARGMSIRRLFDNISPLLKKICPVMLMTPISVAQYLDASFPKFDYVIFDEASQLPTCEAVGALSRGENVIIAGDSKQLPPTSFFSVVHVDEDNYEKEDLESILDDCLALAMPNEHLLWHYRSRHESLIAYSNAKYYDNKLFTFPSPDSRVSRVTRIAVNGCYDRSGTRTNVAEAVAVVNEIVRRLKSEELRKQSIGVVTFSLPQQVLIDDLLADAFRNEPELEKIAEDQYEPIIIKNLENVQGDERDVIIFSIGFGPDKNGKLTMDFGPLNREGGWRRLNVAITRARRRMLVFSVISSDMIDLSGTRSEGVEGLKGFLKFAEQGGGLAVKAGASRMTAEGFEKVVADELRKKGYNVDCSVGFSDFKIDVAVASPDDADKYILALFCGSRENCENSTAEERYLSQPKVLNGLGWETMNIHVLDWIDNKEKVIERIESKIKVISKNPVFS